jgi:hypothetical protein
VKCYKRFDASFTGAQDPKSVLSATVTPQVFNYCHEC